MDYSKVSIMKILLGSLMLPVQILHSVCINPCFGYNKWSIIHGTECNSYILCNLNKVYKTNWCRIGTGYDFEAKKCTWKAYIECQKKKLIKKKENEGVFVCPGNLQEAFYPNFTLGCPTTRYIRCNSGVQTSLWCPSGTYFNDATSTCDVITKISCSVENLQCPQNLPYGVLADYTSGCPPSKYFICSGYYDDMDKGPVGYKSHEKCPEGLYYNEGIKTCDHIQNIPCQHNIKH